MKNPLVELIEEFETKHLVVFKPTQKFYRKVGINQKKFVSIKTGKLSINTDEIAGLSEHFGVKADELFQKFLLYNRETNSKK